MAKEKQLKSEEYAIECTGLTRKFGDFTAVDSIDLKVRKGEIFGFLGPNGAGKTTTIKMLTTLLTPTHGEAKVAGYDLHTEAPLIRESIGIVPQEFALFAELTPMENMWYIGELYGMKRDLVLKRSEELLKIVELYDKKDIPCEGFSGGMKQRLSVATALLPIPKILFMDEPTTGLDPQSRIALRDLTRKLNQSGITILYTTHDMEEADKLCDRIAIMNLGKLVALGTSAELKSEYGGGYIIEVGVDKHDPSLLSDIKRITNADSIGADDGVITVKIKESPAKVISSISHLLEKRGISVSELRTIEPSLENVFINSTARKGKGS
jgi:ABC-2 type transport system ATP-binding protein